MSDKTDGPANPIDLSPEMAVRAKALRPDQSPEMTKHTPEPWEIVGKFSDKIYHAPSDTVVAQSWYPGASSISPADTMIANARRIVACVNACAGMSDPAAEIAALRAERDEWEAKAERYREALEIMGRDESLKWVGFIARDYARAAIEEE